MKKISLQQLAEEMPILDVLDQASMIGGGNGTVGNPYTESEADVMIDNGTFGGGFVDDGNSVSYWLGVVTCYASYSYGYTGGGYGYGYGYSSSTNTSPFLILPVDYGDSSSNSSNEWDESVSPWENNGPSCLYMDSPNNPDSYFSYVINAAENAATASDLYGGKTQIGSNLKLYFEKKSGRVFYGNQYVGTTSLSNLGHVAGKFLGTANIVYTVYEVHKAYQEDGVGGAAVATAHSLASTVWASAGAEIGAVIGSGICPGPGSVLGAIAGSVVGGVAYDLIIELSN